MKQKGFILLPTVIVIALIALLGYFAYQNIQPPISPIEKPDSNTPLSTPSPVPSPSQQVLKRVIVGVKIDPPWQPEGNIASERQKEQRAAIIKTVDQVLSGLDASKVYTRFEFIPSFAIKADPVTLEYLSNHPLVVSIVEDKPVSPTF